jgi:hypothetical protein
MIAFIKVKSLCVLLLNITIKLKFQLLLIVQGIVGSSRPRSSRAAAALATMAKGDDKLTRKAEEQAAKVIR